jgi:hypothetical protein
MRTTASYLCAAGGIREVDVATLKTGTTIAGQTAWHAGNDGAGSGLDADLVDGLHANQIKYPTIATTAPTATRVGEMWVDTDDMILAESDWITPTLINGWAVYGTPPWETPRYCRLYGNMIFVEGLVAGGANGSVAWVFPVGFRPSGYLISASQHNPNVSGTFHVYPTGEMYPYFSQSGGDTQWASVHGMFYADQ